MMHLDTASLDIMITQLQERFQGSKTLNENFYFLTPDGLTKLADEELINSANKFAEKYDEDISEDIAKEIISFRNLILPDIKKMKCIRYNS